MAEVVRALQVSEVTYYRWRKKYGGMRVEQAKRLREVERENARLRKRLRKAVADLTLDKLILEEAAKGNYFPEMASFCQALKIQDRTARLLPRCPILPYAL